MLSHLNYYHWHVNNAIDRPSTSPKFMTSYYNGATSLTHLPLDKMAAISQTTFSNALNEKFFILIQISLKFDPKDHHWRQYLIDLRTAQVYWDAIFLTVYLNFHHFCGWGGWGGDIQKLADIFPQRGLIGLLSSQR